MFNIARVYLLLKLSDGFAAKLGIVGDVQRRKLSEVCNIRKVLVTKSRAAESEILDVLELAYAGKVADGV